MSLLNGTTVAINGKALNFGSFASSTPDVVNIGSIGGGSSPEVAAAANSAYVVADSNGNAGTGTLGEHLVFLGTDNGGNAEFWSFQAPLLAATVNGISTLAPINSADLSGNHLVDANEITLIAIVIGVPASSLTAHDLA